MILSFTREFPWGEPTNFKQKIKAGAKIHTFRSGERWQTADKIRFWEGNPSNTTMNPEPFILDNYDLAELWAVVPSKADGDAGHVEIPLVFAVETFELTINQQQDSEEKEVTLKIGNLFIDTPELLEMIAINDGFDSLEEFIEWFSIRFKKKGIQKMKGQVIHWTDQLYDPESAEALSKINF